MKWTLAIVVFVAVGSWAAYFFLKGNASSYPDYRSGEDRKILTTAQVARELPPKIKDLGWKVVVNDWSVEGTGLKAFLFDMTDRWPAKEYPNEWHTAFTQGVLPEVGGLYPQIANDAAGYKYVHVYSMEVRNTNPPIHYFVGVGPALGSDAYPKYLDEWRERGRERAEKK